MFLSDFEEFVRGYHELHASRYYEDQGLSSRHSTPISFGVSHRLLLGTR